MNCKWCKTENRDTARFCATCRAALVDGLKIESLESGQKLNGRYDIRILLGKGGLGAVYGALDTNLVGKRVAVKEYSPGRITNPAEQQTAAAMFKEEAQMLVQLNHPNLPQISDYFEEGLNQYLVMDFIDGMTLDQYLGTHGRVAESQVVLWGQQIADVLRYLHAQAPPIIFRDMKPQNVMIDRQSRIKLIDFGIARTFKPGQHRDTQQFGTPGFAPPEAYGRMQTDARSDVYSLSVTMYVLLTGYDPTNDPFNLPPLRTLAPYVSTNLERTIEVGRQLNPDQRWKTMDQLTTALSAAPAGPPQSVNIPAGGTGVSGNVGGGKTRGLTQNLAERAAGLSTLQLVLLLGGVAAVSLLLVAIFTGYVAANNPAFDTQYPMLATIGVLAYVASRKVWAPLLAFTPLAIAAFWVTGMSLGGLNKLQVDLGIVVVAAFVAGLFMMGWAALQPSVVGKGAPRYYSQAQSRLDVIWAVLMGLFATIIFTIGSHSPAMMPWAEPTMYVFGALNGLVGWFIGDFFYRLTWERKDQALTA